MWHFSADTWVFHLGMTGRLLLNQQQDSPYLKVRFEFGKITADFIDVRRFGFLLSGERALAALPHGTDALLLRPDDLTRTKLIHSISNIKNLLLDQGVVAGLGNIYVSELLFVAGVDPRRRGKSLKPEEINGIVRACHKVLRRAIEAKGSSISDYVYSLPGEKAFQTGSYQKQFLVYGRAGEACKKCSGKIRRIVQAGRATFFCPGCQV